MTPDDPRVDRPYQRERRTTELPGTMPVRGPSERSGTRSPPSVASEMSAVREALEMALPGALAEHERRMRVLAQGLVAHQQSEAEMTLTHRLSKWQRWAAILGLLAGTAASAAATRWSATSDISEAAEAVAVEAAEAKAVEIKRTSAEARELAIESANRVDAMEAKLDKVLVAVDALVEQVTPPTEVKVPRKPRAK